MKKYSTSSTYGQCVAGRIAYWEKMGIANGIIRMLKDKLRNNKLDINDWLYEYGNEYKEYRVSFIIPTPNNKNELLFKYPAFHYNDCFWYIDMIHFDDELQVHFMGLGQRGKPCENGGWHCVREALNLNDMMALYEYIDDRIDDLIVLPKNDSDKYNTSGALGIGCDNKGE